MIDWGNLPELTSMSGRTKTRSYRPTSSHSHAREIKTFLENWNRKGATRSVGSILERVLAAPDGKLTGLYGNYSNLQQKCEILRQLTAATLIARGDRGRHPRNGRATHTGGGGMTPGDDTFAS